MQQILLRESKEGCFAAVFKGLTPPAERFDASVAAVGWGGTAILPVILALPMTFMWCLRKLAEYAKYLEQMKNYSTND